MDNDFGKLYDHLEVSPGEIEVEIMYIQETRWCSREKAIEIFQQMQKESSSVGAEDDSIPF